jgi:hypothetical protein
MKIKLTHPANGHLAGEVIELPDKQALELIQDSKAVEVVEDFEPPVYYEERKTRKVKHGDG